MAEVKRLFEFLEFRSLMDRLNEALGAKGAAAAGAVGRRSLEAEVVRPARRRPRQLAAAGRPRGARRRRRPGPEPRAAARCSGWPSCSTAAAADVAWLPADIVADPQRCSAALTDGRPLRAHQAKALLRALAALGIGVPRPGHGHRHRRLPARPGRDPLRRRRPAGALHRRPPARGGRAGRASSTSARRASTRPRWRLARRWPSAAWRRRWRRRSRPRAWPRCTPRSRTRSCGCWPGWRTSASPSTGRELEALNTRLTAETQRLGEQLRDVVGRDFNLNSPIQLRQILYDERGLSPRQEDQDRLLHRRRHAGEAAGRVARVHRAAAAVPGGGEAAVDLRRGAAGRGGARRPHPRHVQPDRGPHRPPLVGPAQPAQHPGPLGGGPPVPPGLRRPRPGSVLLVADYNQIELRCIAHLAEDPGLIAAFTAGEDIHTATASRVFGVEAERRHRPHALDGQDGQLRAGLRHGGLRARAAAQHPHGRGRGHPRRLLRRLPQRAGLHGAHGEGGPHAGLHRDAVRPPAPHPRAVQLQLPHPPGRRAPGHERRHPGPGGRHLQGGAGPPRPAPWRPAATPAASSSRCTTRCWSRCPRASRTRSAPLTVDTMRGAAELRVPLEVNLAFGPTWADAKG